MSASVVRERPAWSASTRTRPFGWSAAVTIRKAARASGKVAYLDVRADGAEIDRAVLMRLREPILHLVRNAVVHGIEPEAARRAAGKRPAGTVRLEGVGTARAP